MSTYAHMLVPLDGSNAAEQVLPYARCFAARLKIPVQLLTVIDIPETGRYLRVEKARLFEIAVENMVRSSENYLRDVAKTFPGAEVTCTIERGRTGEVIVEKASTDKGMLIAMATHGRSGLNRFLLGSVAEKVLRGTANPLLLVRAKRVANSQGEAALKSIIVPLDGSERAEIVLPIVGEVAKKLGLEVVLFRAYEIPFARYSSKEGYYSVGLDYDKLVADERNEANEYLEKKVAGVKKLGVSQVNHIFREGIASDEIIALGHETADNLIAICSHGRTGMERWVLGSVTETIVRHASGPVLICRAS